MVNKIKSTFDKGVATVSIKSGVFIESTKIKTHISNLQEEIRSEKANLGHIYYEMWKSQNINTEECQRLCSILYQKETEIVKQQEKLEQIQNESKQLLGEKTPMQNTCGCGMTNSPNAKFCAKCGSKLQI